MKSFAMAATSALALAAAAPAAADEALDAARAAYVEAWEAAPLSVRKMALVREAARGFGLYEERPSNIYAPDEPILIYLEPVGYGYKEIGQLYEFGLNVGLRVLTSGLEEVFVEPDFLVVSTTSGDRPMEFHANITLNLTGFPKGAYTLELILSDIASNELALTQVPIEIR